MRWDNAGTEPSDSLKTSGYSAGMKPAANTFNYQINNASACLTELQTTVSGIDTSLTTLNGQAVKGIRGNGTLVSPDTSQIVNLNAHNIGAATASHSHNAVDINAGTLPASRGGTGGTSYTEARTNLEVMKQTVLYQNNSGTQSTITLSDDLNNFLYVEIFFRDNNNVFGSMKISSEYYGNTYYLSTVKPATTMDKTWLKVGHITLSGSTILFDSSDSAQIIYQTTPSIIISKTLSISICKVCGYSY